MSLRVKIAVALALLAGVIAALASTGAYLTASRQLSDAVDESLLTQAGSLVEPRPARPDRNGAPARPFGGDAADRCPSSDRLRFGSTAQLLVDGEVVVCADGVDPIVPTGAELDLAASAPGTSGPDEGYEYLLRTVHVDGRPPLRVVTMAIPEGGALQLSRDLGEAESILDGLRARLAAIALGGIVLAAVVGFLLATRIVAPIRRLTRTAEHIAETRDLTTTIPPSGSDEIGSLAASFTTMVASLAASQEQQQRLISDASHEMRTPLTSLRTNLELLARAERAPAGALPPDERASVIDDLQFETGELTALLTELVELATDQSGSSEATEQVRFDELCQAIAERARRRTGRTIEFRVDQPDATVAVRPHMIERAVTNLIDNAAKYSPGHEPIELAVDGGRVEVRDHGAGIAPEDLPRIFDRFYRATSARTAPGSGLGLAIVAQIVTAHRGRVFASNHPDGGAVVGFELPEAPDSGVEQLGD